MKFIGYFQMLQLCTAYLYLCIAKVIIRQWLSKNTTSQKSDIYANFGLYLMCSFEIPDALVGPCGSKGHGMVVLTQELCMKQILIFVLAFTVCLYFQRERLKA